MDLTKTGKIKRIAAGKARRLQDPGMTLRRRTRLAERVRVRAREMQVPMGSVAGAARAVASKLPIARIVLVFGLIAMASLGVLIGVNAYAKSKQITIRLENGIAPQMITTTARTVGEMLEQNDIQTVDSDKISPPKNTRLTDGMTVMIIRAMVVYITDKDRTQQIYMTGGTVGDALTAANIAYDDDDDITPDADMKLTSGVRITYASVVSDIVTEYQYIKYSTEYKSTNQLLKGKTQVLQSGKQGIQTKQIQVVYKDGVEVSRKEFSNMITQEPISRIILKGVGVPQRTTVSTGKSGGGNSGGSSGGNSGSGNDGKSDDKEPDLDGSESGRYADVRPEDLIVPAAPGQFESIIYMQITAYTHTGRRTARGGWPQYTRTLEKPGTIAVDSKAIPYGTLLYVTGYGYCIAEDTGSNKVDSSKMGDVFMNTKAECYRWGRKRNLTVYIVQFDYKRPK